MADGILFLAFAWRGSVTVGPSGTARHDGWIAWWQHAFAIPSPAAFAPTPQEERCVRFLAAKIAARGMMLPAIALVESWRPLSAVGSQALRLVEPWFATVADPVTLRLLADLLERPGAIDFILREFEQAEHASSVTVFSNSPMETLTGDHSRSALR